MNESKHMLCIVSNVTSAIFHLKLRIELRMPSSRIKKEHDEKNMPRKRKTWRVRIYRGNEAKSKRLVCEIDGTYLENILKSIIWDEKKMEMDALCAVVTVRLTRSVTTSFFTAENIAGWTREKRRRWRSGESSCA